MAVSPGFKVMKVWAAVCEDLGIERDIPEDPLTALQRYIRCHPEDNLPGIVLLFDEVDALTSQEGALLEFMDIICAVPQDAQTNRVLSVVLCGSERLPLDVLEVTEDASWSLMTTKHSLLSHNFNTQDIIALLKMALGEHSIMIPNDEVAAMAPLLMSATEGLKGLTGACLHQLYSNWHTAEEPERQLRDAASLNQFLNEKLNGTLLHGTNPSLGLALQRVLNDRSGDMQDVLDDILMTAPLLDQYIQQEALTGRWRRRVLLPVAPADKGALRAREECLMEEALSLLDTSKLVQGKVSKAGDHVLKSAWQHEMSHLGFELRSASVPEDIAKRYAGFLLFEHMDGGLIFAMRVRVIRPEEHTQRVRAQAKLHELFKRFPPWPDLANMSQVLGVNILLDYPHNRILIQYQDRMHIKEVKMKRQPKTVRRQAATKDSKVCRSTAATGRSIAGRRAVPPSAVLLPTPLQPTRQVHTLAGNSAIAARQNRQLRPTCGLLKAPTLRLMPLQGIFTCTSRARCTVSSSYF
eukprot:jgi/Chrzof1/12686/Cz07g04010.t1